MSTTSESAPITNINSPSPLRTYPVPRKGYLVLACRKCQKKLQSGHEVANLRKTLKRRPKHHLEGLHLRILQVPCLKLCPKDAVTVCTQNQFAQGLCSIVRTRADLDALLLQCRNETH